MPCHISTGLNNLETLDGKHYAQGYLNAAHDATWCPRCNLLNQTGKTEYQPDNARAEPRSIN